MADLDGLVQNARDVAVRADAADRYVRELERWAPPVVSRRPWWLVGAGAAVAAAAIVALVVVRRPGSEQPLAPVRIGDRVAIVADVGTSYRVLDATADETRIAIDDGTVTARLWHDGHPHRLSLEGGGVVAVATGTVFSLTVGEPGPVVHVDRGRVEVTDAAGVHIVTESPRAGADRHSASLLLALSSPPSLGSATPAVAPAIPAPVDAAIPPDAAVAPPPTSPPRAAASSASAAPSVTVAERWRHERTLHGQGKLDEALAQCLAIADARDPTWSPIALAEGVRIALGPLSKPERAIELADRLLREWPTDALAGEVRGMRCRALTELGRGAECEAGSDAR
jgi:hypothetical protein